MTPGLAKSAESRSVINIWTIISLVRPMAFNVEILSRSSEECHEQDDVMTQSHGRVYERRGRIAQADDIDLGDGRKALIVQGHSRNSARLPGHDRAASDSRKKNEEDPTDERVKAWQTSSDNGPRIPIRDDVPL